MARTRNYLNPIVKMSRFRDRKELSIVTAQGQVVWLKFDHALKLATNLLQMVVGELITWKNRDHE